MSDAGLHVAVVDYGMGNLYSVQRACDHVGLPAAITASPDDVRRADAVILPGVGAMPDAMRTLDETGMSDVLREQAARGTLLFGVCLGMQLLMEEGSEFLPHRGLGLIPGRVRRFEGTAESGVPLKVPHIGWSPVWRQGSDDRDPWMGSPLEMTHEGEFMYFIHSYYVVPDDPRVGTAWSRYGDVKFCSALAAGNVFGCQFHPERSGPPGLRFYSQLARLVADRVAGRDATLAS